MRVDYDRRGMIAGMIAGMRRLWRGTAARARELWTGRDMPHVLTRKVRDAVKTVGT